MLTLVRRLALLASLVCSHAVNAGALDFAIIVSDGTPARERLALRAELQFLDMGSAPENVVRLSQPGAANWSDAFALARASTRHNVVIFMLGDTQLQGGVPTLKLGSGSSVSPSVLRAQLDALSPHVADAEIVVLDGDASSAFLPGLANPAYALGQRRLYGHARDASAPDDPARVHGYASYWLNYASDSALGSVRSQTAHHAATSLAEMALGYFGSMPYFDANGDGVATDDDFFVSENGVLAFTGPLAGSATRDRAIVVGSNARSDIEFAAVSAAFVRGLGAVGYGRSSIAWLSDAPPGSSLGVPDALPTPDAVYAALRAAGGADDVVVYLAGHGSATSIRINATDTIRYSQLAAELAQLQLSMSGHLTVIVDSCSAGGLIDQYADYARLQRAPDITIVASSRAGEDSRYLYGGTRSLTGYFLASMTVGGSVGNSARYAHDAYATIRYRPQAQTPQIDADSDGVANEPEDYELANYPLTGTVSTAPPGGGGGYMTPPDVLDPIIPDDPVQ